MSDIIPKDGLCRVIVTPALLEESLYLIAAEFIVKLADDISIVFMKSITSRQHISGSHIRNSSCVTECERVGQLIFVPTA